MDVIIKNTIESINLNKQNNNNRCNTKEIENMTLDEKIGQIITIGIDGYTINDKTKELIVDKRSEELYCLKII